MNESGIAFVVDILKALAEAELSAAHFYKRCAISFTNDEEFWNYLATQEEKHARNLAGIYRLLKKKPDRFSIGRRLNVAAIRTFNRGIEENTKRLESGALKQEYATILARDIENAIIENRFTEILLTDDIEYNTYVGEIVSDTQHHIEAIRRKITSSSRIKES